MFFHACKTDGCTNREASVLYIGVRIGTWYAVNSPVSRSAVFKTKTARILKTPAEVQLKGKFDKAYYNLEDELDTISIGELEQRVNLLL